MSDLSKIDNVNGVPIYQVKGEPPSFLFRAGYAIDADGAPDCYNADNTGIDWTENGGTPGGNWWGGPVDSEDQPLQQKIYDPCPGYYVSGTAHCNPAYAESSPYRYLDSNCIPFFVLPNKHSCGAQLGDVGLVYNQKNGENCYAIYGDIGPSDKIGEGSIRLAQALAIPSNPKTGGTESRMIAYVVFPGSVARWVPPADWFAYANKLFRSWGGLSRLINLLEEFP